MQDRKKTKEQLIRELMELRQRVSQVQAEAADQGRVLVVLADKERWLRTLLETARDVIWTVDLQLKYTYVSPSVQELLGYTPNEIMTLNPMDTVTPTSRELLARAFQEEMRLEAPEPRDRYAARVEHIEQYRKDGSTCWIEITTTFLRDEHGQPTGILGISRDITERKGIEERLRKGQDDLERRVQERTIELRRTNERLAIENAERKKTEEALRESEQKYRLLIDNANELICVIQEGVFVFVNPRSTELSGYSEEELTARPFLEVVHADDREIALQRYMETMGRETAIDPFVLRVLDKSGNTRWGYARSVRIDWNGRPAALVFGTEITDLKIAEEASAKEKAFSEGIIDSLPGIFYLFDEELELVRWNKNFEKVSGFSAQQLSGMNGLDFFEGEDRQVMEQGVRETFEKGETSRVANFRGKDGSKAPYLLTGRRIELNRNRYLVGMGIDIAARKKAEEALRESEEKYRLHFENVSDVVYSYDRELRILDISPSVERVLGYSVEELVGKRLSEIPYLLPAEYLERAQQDTNRVLSGERIESSIYHCIAKDGRTFVAEISGAPLRREGKIIGVVSVARDITERTRAEEELRIKDHAISSSISGIAIADLSGILTYANPAAVGLWGYDDIKQVVGRPVIEFWEDAEKARDSFRGAARTGAWVGELVARRKDGSRLDVQVATTLVRDGAGKPIAIMGSFLDIREAKKAQQELQKSERLLKTILATTPTAIELVEDRRIKWANESMERMFGFSDAGEYVDQRTRILYSSEQEFERGGKVLYSGLGAGVITEADLKLKRKNGAVFDCHVRLTLMDPSDPTNKTVVATISDISDRKRAEEALRQSEQRFRTLAEASPFGMATIGEDGTFQYINPKFKELFGYDLHDVPNGREWFRRAYPDPTYRHNVISTWMDDAARTDKAELRQRTFTVRCKDGTEKTINFRSVLLPSGQSLMTCQDITETKRAEELLVQAERLKAIGDLAGGVAHNFNNLLQMIMGGIDLALIDLEMGNLSETKKTLEQLLDSAKFGAETVRRLQSFAQVRAEIADSEADFFDLSETARQAVEMTKTWWKTGPEKEGIRLALKLRLTDGCLVRGKQSELFEVLINLIKNAAEALPEGGEIHVKTSAQGNHVILEVADTGVGISHENLKKVFQPFWSTKGVGTGTGMGLAVTHGIIASHGGTISVRSSGGKGTTFTVELPLVKGISKEPAPVGDQIFRGKLNILVVDDMFPILRLLERLLTKHDQTVFSAVTGEEALDIFMKNRIDLIICDLGMPGMNGWEFGKAVKASCRHQGMPRPPFILLTGWAGQELDQEKISESGVDAVIAKPLDNKKLMGVLRKVIKEGTKGALEA